LLEEADSNDTKKTIYTLISKIKSKSKSFKLPVEDVKVVELKSGSDLMDEGRPKGPSKPPPPPKGKRGRPKKPRGPDLKWGSVNSLESFILFVFSLIKWGLKYIPIQVSFRVLDCQVTMGRNSSGTPRFIISWSPERRGGSRGEPNFDKYEDEAPNDAEAAKMMSRYIFDNISTQNSSDNTTESK
jgi:hypothetical protein